MALTRCMQAMAKLESSNGRQGIKIAVHPDARLQTNSHTPMPAEVACHGRPTWSFCLATIVNPASSIS